MNAHRHRISWSLLLAPLYLAFVAYLLFELGRPDLLIIGNITVDLVDGTTPTGGAVSYAAVVAKALKARSCVVTVAGPEADLGVFEGSELYIIKANETLTFEHTYTWWGHSRKLRVTANPNITIGRVHVPFKCQLARVVLLGPLTLHDVDARSFVQFSGFWDRLLNRNQMIGLMAQGFQRDLGPAGQVMPLPAPSKRLLDGLGPRVSLFLSDVETDTWSKAELDGVAASCDRVVVTLGEKGAVLLANGSSGEQHIPAVKVPKAVDTNGAGDTFATTFMIALMRADRSPGSTAAWAASRAVMQPQTCKPRCAPALITSSPEVLRPIGSTERLHMAVQPLLQRLQHTAGPLVQQVAAAAAAAASSGPAADLAQLAWLKQASQWLGIGSSSSSRSSSRGSSSSTGSPADKAASKTPAAAEAVTTAAS